MIEVRLIDHMGSDLTVVNAARVSFAKHVEAFAESDRRLLGYLAQHQHWTPFAHPQLTFHVKAPVFVRTQCFKHKVGLTENEVSRRYVDEAPEFFYPESWRGRSATKKQGSSNVEVMFIEIEPGVMVPPGLLAEDLYRTAREIYDQLINGGVAPEQARMVLPQGMMTEWFWTGSLAAFGRFCRQRLSHEAQAETAQVAMRCSDLIAPLFPSAWSVLMGSFVNEVAA